jgi:hypothetical protein
MKIVSEGCHFERNLDGNVQTLPLQTESEMSTVRHTEASWKTKTMLGLLYVASWHALHVPRCHNLYRSATVHTSAVLEAVL